MLKKFESDHVSYMERFPDQHFVLLIDFDEQDNRLSDVKEKLPKTVKDRVFVIGVRSEPEELRQSLKFQLTLEEINRYPSCQRVSNCQL